MKRDHYGELIQPDNRNEVKLISTNESGVKADGKDRGLLKGVRKPNPRIITITIIMTLATLFLAPRGCDNVNWKLDISA